MDLSIIIVNYNVRHFLEQCLNSVKSASNGLSSEIIIIDNNSADGSCAMVHEKFKDVLLIQNSENIGFSKANNQALKIAKGKYVLLLNPDTVLDEKSLETCFDFMESNLSTGAVGLKMIDGKGKFLPESKRALPTPEAALYKFLGLSTLFPSSEKFNRYYLGNLSNSEIQEIEVLTGAFMFIRSSALEKVGLLDESFFMYAEDIDLSYRLSLKGYKIYYLPKPSLIHYKGESTRKSDFNYPIHFYGSMIRFVSKYYKGRKAATLSVLMKFAIFLRASLSLFKRFVKIVALPIVDMLVLYTGLTLTLRAWEIYKYKDLYTYPDVIQTIAVPGTIFITILLLTIWGVYRRNPSTIRTIIGSFTASFVLILIYSFLPLDLRYSRAVVLIWSLLIPSVVIINRSVLAIFGHKNYRYFRKRSKRIIVISSEDDYKKIINILSKNQNTENLLGRICIDGEGVLNCLGKLNQLEEIIRINRPEEIVLSSNYLNTSDIISILSNPKLSGIDKKIASIESDYLIESNNPKQTGEVYTVSSIRKK